MSAHLTIHGVKHIYASSTKTTGAPLSITFHGENRMDDSISIYTDDQVLTDRLIEAINAVVHQRWHETSIIEARIANEAHAYAMVQADSASAETACDHHAAEQV